MQYLESYNESPKPDRRRFMWSAAALAGFALWRFRHPLTAEARAKAAGGGSKVVKIVQFSDAGKREDVVQVPKLVKTEDEWRKQLTQLSFEVTRHAATETAFTGQYWNLHDKGLFRCICCDTALFDSATKFDSGTGWPSFWTPIAKENVEESMDLSLGVPRTAVACRRCDAHLGHVFDDGPPPTGLRYCMNSASLRFVKRA